jgi:hypothetical protein
MVSISARRGGSFSALRLAVALAALGGICLVAGAVVANVLADHSSSDSSASSLAAVGLAGFGVAAVLGAAVAGGSVALARLRRPDPAATGRRNDLRGARRNDLRGARRRHLGLRVADLGTLRLAVALAALGGFCLTGGVLAGVLSTNLSSPASTLISLIAGLLVALGLLTELAAATMLASGGTTRLWRRIRRL